MNYLTKYGYIPVFDPDDFSMNNYHVELGGKPQLYIDDRDIKSGLYTTDQALEQGKMILGSICKDYTFNEITNIVVDYLKHDNSMPYFSPYIDTLHDEDEIHDDIPHVSFFVKERVKKSNIYFISLYPGHIDLYLSVLRGASYVEKYIIKPAPPLYKNMFDLSDVELIRHQL